jgi:hypothetical protein
VYRAFPLSKSSLFSISLIFLWKLFFFFPKFFSMNEILEKDPRFSASSESIFIKLFLFPQLSIQCDKLACFTAENMSTKVLPYYGSWPKSQTLD